MMFVLEMNYNQPNKHPLNHLTEAFYQLYFILFFNSFGIILKGSALVYARKEQSSAPQQDSFPIPRGNKDRTALVGPDLGMLTEGSSFGEMTMTSSDHQTYNATIVAEELAFVLLIDKELYSRSFGAHRLDWQNKVQFVKQSPLFQNLTSAIKNLLIVNLKPREIQFGNRFVKQGSACNSLFFVCHGWGKVIADVRLSMTQYETMKAGGKTKDKSAGRHTVFERKHAPKTPLDPSRPLSVIERRRHRQEYGYVAIETLLRQRESQVTTTGPNDVIGDIEIIMNLPTYCTSVECMEHLQVYELSKSSFYQIIAHRCAQTYSVIKNGVQSKLRFRSQRLREIPLYTLLYERSLLSSQDRKKTRGTTGPSERRATSLWIKKALEVQNMKKEAGMVKHASGSVEIDPKETTSW